MISENTFTEKDKEDLAASSICSEMGSATEWIAREEPDQLFPVFVAPTSDGSLQTACACPLGTRDLKCLHALDVITRVRADENVLVQIFKRRQPANA